MSEPTGVHFVEITVTVRKKARTYRFYGRGIWHVMVGDGWHPINAIYVPAEALAIAAGEVRPEPPTAVDLFGM